MTTNKQGEFERAASQRGRSIIGEAWQFMAENKKWWLLPIFAAMIVLGALAVAGSSAAAPFIYTLF
jgi:hypothetical protein